MRRVLRFAVGVLPLLVILSGCSFFGQEEVSYTNWEPQLSPDGTTLVYESPVDGSLELFTLDLATDVTRQLTDDEVEDWSPVWSPDGTKIVFASIVDKNADIYVLDLETLEKTRLTTDEADDINPDWGTNGLIYFNSNRSDAWEIYSIDPESRRLVKITETIE